MKIKLAKKDVKTLGLLLLCFLFLYVATFMYMNESLFSYDHFRNALLSQSIAEHGEFTLIGTAYYKHTFFYYLVFAMPFLIFKTYAAQTYAMIIISLLALGFNYIFFKHNFSRRIALFTTLCLGLYSSYVYYSLRVMHEVLILFVALVSLMLFYEANKENKFSKWIVAGISAGIALLIKQPLGLMFPAVGFFMIIVFYKDFKRFFIYLINGDMERFLANRFVNLFISFFVALFIYSPWYFFTKVNGSTFSWLKEFRMEYAWMQGRDPDSVMKFFTQFAESLAPSYLGLVLAIFLAFFLVYGIGIALLRINKKHKFRELEILFLFFAGFIIALQTAWPIKELRFFFPIYPILLYFVYVGITDFSKRIKHKVQIHESTLSRYLIIIVIAIFLTSSANMIIAKEDTVATDLKAVQQYALEQGILDKNWGSDQRMSAAYYLDPHILHIVDLQGQIIQIMSYNIEYIALKKETIPPAELFTHVADVKSFKIYKVEREQLRSLFSQNNNVATGAVSLNNNMPHKKVYYSLQVAGFNNNHALYSGRTHEDGSFEMFVPQTQEGQKIIATFYSWGYKMKSVEIIPGQIHTVSLEEGSFFKHDVPISSF